MKLVFNTDQVYLHGGIEKVMATKANYLANLPNVEVVIVTTEQGGELPCYPLDSKIKLVDLGVKYNRTKSYFSKENLIKAIQHYRRQKKVLGQLKPNAIISPNYNFDHYWLPFIKTKAQLIKERHSSRYQEPQKRQQTNVLKKIVYRLNDWIEKKYDTIVVLNQDEAAYVRTDNAVVIPNPIEQQELTAQLEAKKVIAAGRISPVKNFGDLIQAWAIVNQRFPDWALDLYGQDYLGTRDQLEQLVIELGLQSKVHFKGSVHQMTETMAEYSIYAMSSETECFPMVLLEAMSVGLPVVSYDCPNGPRNIITDKEDGLLVEHLSVEKLAEALQDLMSEEGVRKKMGHWAKQNAKKFSTTHVMQQWQNLLNLPHV